jgi:hypothetical protein
MKIGSIRTNDSQGQLDLRVLYPSATHTETYSYRKRQEDRALRGFVRISNVRTRAYVCDASVIVHACLQCITPIDQRGALVFANRALPLYSTSYAVVDLSPQLKSGNCDSNTRTTSRTHSCYFSEKLLY